MNIEEKIKNNIGLVYSCTNKYKHLKSIEYDDLYQSAILGLFIAIKTFNSELGYEFSTYAVKVINVEMFKYFKSVNIIKLPDDIIQIKRRAKKEKENNPELRKKELCKLLGVSIREYDKINMLSNVNSLFSPTASGSDDCLIDFVKDNNNYFEKIDNNDWYNDIVNNSCLTEVEFDVLNNWCNGKMLKDASDVLKFNRALIKIRLYLSKCGE